jgi:uncharacterized protein YjbI with pentapeptide repeats
MIYEDEKVDLLEVAFDTRHEFFNCTFENLNLNQLSLVDSLFDECTFQMCDLSNATITYSTFNECEFIECKLIGINWTTTTRISDLKFKQSNLSFNVFMGLTIKNFLFDDCLLRESDFAESILDKSVFTGSNLSRSIFNNTSLKDCDLAEASDYSINPLNNQIKGAIFNKVDALDLLSFFGIKLK